MYDQFYGFTGRPFQLTPDPHFYFESLTHRKALSYLGYGLAQGEGFIVITGDIGAGKTTLVGHLMATIDKARLSVANIVTTQLDAKDMVRMAAQNFGIDVSNKDKAGVLDAIEQYLHAEARAGRRSLLIVDEAQNLPIGALEELRMLSNFQLGNQALLQIFLLGQPEFRDMVQTAPELEQLRQRVIATHHLDPMEADEIEPYIAHRLSKVGWDGRPDFSEDAIPLLYEATGGVPRMLNSLLSRVLLFGAIEQTDKIDRALVESVIVDLAGETPSDEVQPVAQKVAQPEVKAEPIFNPKPAVDIVKAAEVAEADTSSIADVTPTPVEPVQAAVTRVSEGSQPAEKPVVEQSGVSKEEFEVALARIAELEASLLEQESTIRRMLSTLIHWVEKDGRDDAARASVEQAA